MSRAATWWRWQTPLVPPQQRRGWTCPRWCSTWRPAAGGCGSAPVGTVRRRGAGGGAGQVAATPPSLPSHQSVLSAAQLHPLSLRPYALPKEKQLDSSRPAPSPPPLSQPFCSLAAFPGGTPIPKDSILTVPCHVLIPAAVGGVITEANAGALQCQVRPRRGLEGCCRSMLRAGSMRARCGGRPAVCWQWYQHRCLLSHRSVPPSCPHRLLLRRPTAPSLQRVTPSCAAAASRCCLVGVDSSSRGCRPTVVCC